MSCCAGYNLAGFELMNTPIRNPVDSSAIQQVISGLMAYEPEEIILFGSAARGDADQYSDLDLIVIKNTETRFLQRLLEVTHHLPVELAVDVFVYTPRELQAMVEAGNPFIEQALMDGKLLYEKSPGDGPWKGIASTDRTSRKGDSPVKKPLETARRWLAQAEHGLVTTRALLQNSLWSDACFHAEQTAQLALKAFLYRLGRWSIAVHSVRELASRCAQEDDEFLPFLDYGALLDRYYLSTRYPDALPEPAVPFESFTQREAEQAVGFAEEIVGLVRSKIPASPSDSTK